ncbi:lytic transglycosylase domain-containing protein [Synechococcus sp. CS-1325]|nr:lytic transglycosylase domain-containing protein [Synechococcus sp. CS-1325]MCT0212618.1 lytic transglycosylase domain-containing protein [Synechococcus sp. CS-1326]MCT0233627.1 lytic transglycosylase domain-containing protein [Synechococcus sp. CS-1327]PZV00639.1 MAG: lytic transglycosylase [Cyanobium sp.]
MRRPSARLLGAVLGGGALMLTMGLAVCPAPFIPKTAVVKDATAFLLPADPARPRDASGRQYPLVPTDPAELATLLAGVEEALRSPQTPAAELPGLGHQQQVIYRVLSHQETRSQQVRRFLPAAWLSTYDRHLVARRAFLAMHRRGRKPTTLPAWRIIQPEPAEALIGYYKKAETATGIAWEVLAAVNLVESGMGRIDGVSVANAQGPMQFLPTTWSQAGIGKGSIRDPHDAIQAAARYLVRRGGLKDIRKGLWGYNNSDNYGIAVLTYASLIQEDPRAYVGLYNWDIHFGSAAGDIWLPVGYDQPRPIEVATFLKRFPASAPPPGSSGY